MTHDEMIAVIAAHKAKVGIQEYCGGQWKDIHVSLEVLLLRLGSCATIRVAPEPMWRPWRTVDEVPIGKLVVRKIDGATGCIYHVRVYADALIDIALAHGEVLSPADMMFKFAMEDGSPCGVKEE